MTTGRDVLQDAFELLRVYAPGELATQPDLARGLSVLNDMLDNWSNYTLACYSILEQSAPLVPGQQSYTIGAGGNFNMTRPLKILADPGTAYTQDSNGNNYPLEVVPRDKWNQYGNRSILIQANFPNVIFYDPQFPLGIINVLPVPTIPYTMFWDSMLQLAELASLNTSLSLPPGYKRAIVTNLAVCLKPYFREAQIDSLIIAEAMRTLGDIKRTNMRQVVAVMEPELVSRAGISYNPYTDAIGSMSR